MSKAIRTALRLVASILLFNVLTMAQAGGNYAAKDKNKDKNKEHHSRLAKVAFWRHHNDVDNNAKPAQATKAPATQAPSKQVQSKTAQIKPASAKQAQVKTAQIKPVSAKQATGKKDQKQEQHASTMNKPAVKKAPAANKTKSQQKAQDPKKVSLKQ
jgi:hypothetical protein